MDLEAELINMPSYFEVISAPKSLLSEESTKRIVENVNFKKFIIIIITIIIIVIVIKVYKDSETDGAIGDGKQISPALHP